MDVIILLLVLIASLCLTVGSLADEIKMEEEYKEVT